MCKYISSNKQSCFYCMYGQEENTHTSRIVSRLGFLYFSYDIRLTLHTLDIEIVQLIALRVQRGVNKYVHM